MKYIWEEEDFRNTKGNGAILAVSPGGETVILTRTGCVSLIDGHRWLSNLSLPDLITHLNDDSYVPVLEQVNAHNLVLKHPRLKINTRQR